MIDRIRSANFRYKVLTVGLFFAFFIFVVHLFTSYGPIQPKIKIQMQRESKEAQKQVLADPVLDINYVEENLYSLDQKDPQLIQYTRVRHLSPPSKLPYRFEGTGNFKDPFSGWVAEFFGNKRNGIFIEAGAHKGEKESHTLYLEKELGWTGLLVECNPTVVPYLKNHHRRAWVAGVCLSPSNRPSSLNFSNPTNWTYSGTFNKPWNLPIPTKWTFFEVETMPLYTILAALGWKEIDYFSFDIEGSELKVLRAFPFDKVIFKVLQIEIFFYTPGERAELDSLLQSHGYNFVTQLQIDKIYVHNSAKHLIKRYFKID